MLVGVVYNGKAMMPTCPARARRLIASNHATPFIHKGAFCIRLNRTPSDNKLQPITVGIDPGSKKEAVSVTTETKTVLNIQIDATTWVKDALEARRNARRARRFRNTPCRKNSLKKEREGWIPPSTKARWQSKFNLVRSLMDIFPISTVVVEDIKARTIKGKSKWNISFSPLETGKRWFYSKLKSLGIDLILKHGYETAELRKQLGLSKTSDKLSNSFNAHCVDSWVLAATANMTNKLPMMDTSMLIMKPMQFHRRQLYAFQATKGGFRRAYGSTRSIGLRRGSIVKHHKYGVCTVGGTSKGMISLHNLQTGKRLCQNAKHSDTTFISFNNYNIRFQSARLKT